MTPLTRAERDLDWFFNAGASAMGLHAQAYEASGGGVWDSERIGALHVARHNVVHRDDVDKYRRISDRLGGMPVKSRVILHARFTPWPWPVIFRSKAGPVVGVTVLTQAAQDAFKRRHEGRGADVARLRDWLALEATTGGASRVFRPIVAEARRMVWGALEGWEERVDCK